MRLIFLSEAFYNDYASCHEILQKHTRPYACLGVKINGQLFAIPLRHHIAHKYAFITHGECGLDYTKAVIITKKRYIANGTPQIDQKEFDAIKVSEDRIVRGMKKYVATYKNALAHSNNPNYRNILKYSSLNHFRDVLK